MSAATDNGPLFKWLRADGRGPLALNSYTYPLPSEGGPGAWTPARGAGCLALTGYYACRAADLALHMSDALYEAEAASTVLDLDREVIAERLRLVRRVPFPAAAARLFALDCAEHALPAEAGPAFADLADARRALAALRRAVGAGAAAPWGGRAALGRAHRDALRVAAIGRYSSVLRAAGRRDEAARAARTAALVASAAPAGGAAHSSYLLHEYTTRAGAGWAEEHAWQARCLWARLGAPVAAEALGRHLEDKLGALFLDAAADALGGAA